MWPSLGLLLGIIVLTTSAQQQQQQQQQRPQMPFAWPPARSTFTPIRVIQAQTPEQRQAIQNLVQELQRSSPELFSALSQPGNQQLALGLPPVEATGGSHPATQPSPAPQAQAQQQPAAPPPAGMSAAAPAPPPPAAASPTEQLASLATAATPTATPLSFALNALFPASNGPPHETPSGALPFGLQLGASETEQSDLGTADPSSTELEQEPSMSGKHRTPSAGSHSRGGGNESSSLDEWAGLDNAAAKPAVTLVAIGLALLGAVGAGL